LAYLVEAFLTALNARPLGNFDGIFEGRRYGVTRTEREGGRHAWLWAEDLGGTDKISENLYRLKSGARLEPCEMAEEKVITFVLGIEPIGTLDT
jgi:hypothetical protein